VTTAAPPRLGPLRVPLRRYQATLLAAVEEARARGDAQFHLVAPPGAGKTLVGLEVVRRLGRPAVVFTPTAALTRRWCDEVERFADGPRAAAALVSTDPAAPGVVTALTYQVISTGASPGRLLDSAARDAWIDELVTAGRVPDVAAARARLDTMAAANPARHAEELGRRRRVVKRALLREGGVEEVARFLHPNARELVDRLVGHGVGTVVLDECHHLLDYWAIVLRHLVARLAADGRPVRVVGLTATPALPGTPDEVENYRELLGDVDIEVPLPALVRNGELAPYRDLVALVRPSPRERAYLDGVHEAFEEATSALTSSEAFVTWLVGLATAPALAARDHADPDLQGGLGDAWTAWLLGEAVLSTAVLRCLARLGVDPPAGVAVPPEAADPMALDDWTVLLERWALDALAVSADPADHEQLERVRQVLRPFGLVLTERGLRRGRPVGDLVLHLSESKDAAVAEILAREHAALGDRLRAIVVTEADQVRSPPAALRGVLDRDAGTARRLLAALVDHDGARATRPVLVTGSTVRAGDAVALELAPRLNLALGERGVDASCSARGTDHPGVSELHGSGPGWAPRNVLPVLTAALGDGTVGCMVGTRALLGEGWDAPAVNTLIDVSGATTATAVQQLRGRSIRLDPDWPGKVAHQWDVVCLDTGHERGDGDLERLRRRHDRLWGLAADGGPDPGPPIVRGLAHVDAELAWLVAAGRGGDVDVEAVTARSLAAVDDRAAVRTAWAVGAPYEDRRVAQVRLLPGPPLRLWTTTGRARADRASRRHLGPAAALAAAVVPVGGTAAALPGAGPAEVVAAGLALAAVAAGGWGVRRRAAARDAWARQPPDAAAIGDVAAAVLAGLVDAGVVGGGLRTAGVEVREHAGGAVEVGLPAGTAADGEAFVTSVREVLGPVREPRYLVSRPARSARRGEAAGEVPVVWHPVPAALGVNRRRAEAFAAHWGRVVAGAAAGSGGDGRLVPAASPEGRAAILAARLARRPVRADLAYERWS